MKALEEAEVSLKDMQHLCYKEKGVMFRTCPVSGHNMHGLAEAKIFAVQECLTRLKIENMRLHATGYQTFLKLVENEMNSLPIGVTYGRARDNSPLLQLIYPNLLRLGRNNQRSLDGTIKLPHHPGELLKKVEDGFAMFYELWNTSIVPKMMKCPKWFDSKSEIKVGDIVYFRKTEGELSSKWTVGLVIDVVHGKDGVVRRCTVQYQNATESKKRETDRAARSLIKLFHIDDTSWKQDLAKFDKMYQMVLSEDISIHADTSHNVSQVGLKLEVWSRGKKKGCKMCCCSSHCSMETHGRNVKIIAAPVQTITKRFEFELLDRSWWSAEETCDMLEDIDIASHTTPDTLTSLIVRTQLDLDLVAGGDEEESH